MYSRKPKQTNTFYRKLTQLCIQENHNKLKWFSENWHKYTIKMNLTKMVGVGVVKVLLRLQTRVVNAKHKR